MSILLLLINCVIFHIVPIPKYTKILNSCSIFSYVYWVFYFSNRYEYLTFIFLYYFILLGMTKIMRKMKQYRG